MTPPEQGAVDMGEAVQRLLDLEELRRLKARYFRSIDTQQWDEFAEVFTEDAVLEVPEVDAVMEGREAIVSMVSSALAGATTAHHGHMPEIDVTGPDSATGIWAGSNVANVTGRGNRSAAAR